MSAGKIVQATLRLPEELHTRLKQLADDERRSLHAEILVLLDEALEARAEAEAERGKAAGRYSALAA